MTYIVYEYFFDEDKNIIYAGESENDAYLIFNSTYDEKGCKFTVPTYLEIWDGYSKIKEEYKKGSR